MSCSLEFVSVSWFPTPTLRAVETHDGHAFSDRYLLASGRLVVVEDEGVFN